jgi:hypothetical protein
MSHAIFLELLLADPSLPEAFKRGVELSAESRQELDSDHFEEMGMEARERELMEEEERGE